MARRKRRVRSPHPGVKLKKRTRPSGTVRWRAHFEDPDTGREVAVTLDPLALPTAEARTLWARQKAEELARRKMEAAAGVRPSAVESIGDAVAGYLDDAGRRLKPKTLRTYRQAFERFEAWARGAKVATTADLTRGQLAALRAHLVAIPKSKAEPGSGRGSRRSSKQARSPLSVNRELRAIKTLLNAWRLHEKLPNLHRDDITDALSALPVPREQAEYMRPADLRKLLEAALRHDAATFAATREEHAGLRDIGTTPRYAPVAPILATLLLTGMRRGEALALRWEMVDLGAVDHEGRKVGEIRLPASVTKTSRARTIGLEVSPGLRSILAALSLRQGREGHVFGGLAPYTGTLLDAARKRLVGSFGAPRFTWQLLRSTCATYLTNAPGIFGGATVFLSAKQLGHSVTVAERHYLGVHRGIPREARTLEAAMQIDPQLAEVLEAVSSPAAAAQGGGRR